MHILVADTTMDVVPSTVCLVVSTGVYGDAVSGSVAAPELV